jgi:hypothetical protein
MKTCDSCGDAVERRNLRLTPSWVIAVCRKCFEQEMQWRYLIDKEWSAETWDKWWIRRQRIATRMKCLLERLGSK